MTSKRRAETLRRARRKRDQDRLSRWSNVRVTYGPELGPGIVQAPIEKILAAVETGGEDLAWSAVENNILPVIPRVRPYSGDAPEPLRTLIAPGIVVGFGIDIGPAFLNVSNELFSGWRISTADLTATAVANVHRRAATVRRSLIHRGQIGAFPTEWLQTGVSVGSTLVLAPSELQRLFGGPRFFITPMRDLIIGFGIDVPHEEAHWLYHEIADLDPNCLGPTAYAFDGARVTPVPLACGADAPPWDSSTASAFLA